MGQSSDQLPDFQTAKHLSHIFLDGEIGGSPLDEGSTLKKTVPSLKLFMAWLKQSSPSAETQVIADLAKHSFQENTARDLEMLITQFEEMSQFEDERESPTLNLSILSIYEKKGDVFFPGGWLGKEGKSGHAMTYRLKKDIRTNEAILMIYNTGAGIQYHGAVPLSSGKQGYYPIYAFKFAYHPHEQGKWLAVLDKLIEPRRLSATWTEEGYNEEKIYEEVLETARAWLNAEIVPGETLSPAILGQRNGTCVWQSCMQVLLASFKNKESFRQFILAFRLYLLDSVVKEKDIYAIDQSMPGYRKLLKQCLSNTARMLDMDLKTGVKEWRLDTDVKNRILEQLEKWKLILSQHGAKRNRLMKPYAENTYSSNRARNDFINTEVISHILAPQNQAIDTYTPEKMSFIDAIKELNRIPSLNDVRTDELIERFCFAFSDSSKSLIDGMNTPSVEEILSELESLKEKYLRCHQSITPRSAVVFLGLMSLMDRLCEEGVITDNKKALSCVPLFVNQMLPFVKRVCANPFLATSDVRLDLLLERMLIFYQAKQEQYKEKTKGGAWDDRRLQYYLDMIRRAPAEEKKAIQAEWQKDKTTPRLSDTLRQFLSRYKQNPEDSYCYSYLKEEHHHVRCFTPHLNRVFGYQERMERYQTSILSILSKQCSKSWDAPRDGFPKKDNTPSRQIQLNFHYAWKTSQSYIFQYYILLENKEKAIFLLRPELLDQHYEFTMPSVKRALTSHYDDNSFNSQELCFSQQRSTFSETHFQPAKRRQDKESQRPIIETLSDSDRLENKLQRLRVSPESIVLLLLSELAEQPEWLLNDDMQQYVELSLFQPGVLLKALRTPSDVWVTLESLFKKYHFSGDVACPEKTEWFLLKLAAKMSAYTLEWHAISPPEKVDKKSQTACLAWQHRLLEATNKRLKEPHLTTEELSEYHTLKLDALLHIGPLTDNQLSELSDAYFILMLLPESDIVGHVLKAEKRNHLLESANDILAAYAKAHPEFLSTLSTHIMELLQDKIQTKGDLKFDRSGSNFQNLVFKDTQNNVLMVRMSSRSILYQDQAIGYLPLSVTSKAEYQHLFGWDPILASQTRFSSAGMAGKCYRFTRNNIHYRILLQNKTFSFQRKENSQWYTLAAPTRSIAKERKIPFFAFDNVPPLFNQADYWCWVNDENNYFIETGKDHRRIYEYDYNPLMTIDMSGKRLAIEQGPIWPLLNRLESSDYIEKEIKNDKYYLPRYQLTLIHDSSMSEFYKALYTADKRYRLECPDNPSDRFGSGVILRAVNKNDEDKYLMPLQPYFREIEKSGEGLDHSLFHDLSNRIPANVMYNKELKEGNQHNRKGWDFNGSERYVQFIYKENTCYAQSAADQIYLAYLYLVQNQPSKASQCLANCEYQGTPDEMLRLWWLIDKLPAILDSSIEPITNSKSIAIQMQALHAMVSLKQHFPACRSLPPLDHIHSDTAWVKHKEQANLQDYIDKLHLHARQLYETYDDRRNNIPVSLKLSIENEKNLLSFIQSEHEVDNQIKIENQRREKEEDPTKQFNKEEDKIPPTYLGVVGTRYLEHFPENLENLTGGTTPSVYFSLERQVKNVTDPLEDTTCDMPYSQASEIDLSTENESCTSAAMQALSPWMTLRNFCRYFPNYYQLTHRNEAAHQKNILHFCQAVLTRYGIQAEMKKKDRKALDEDKKIMITMASVLWAVHHAPDQFPKQCSQMCDDRHTTEPKYGIFRQLQSKYKAILTQFPIPLITRIKVERLYQVKPIHYQPPLPVASRLVMTEGVIDPIDSIKSLIDLREKIQALEAQYDQHTEALIKEMGNLNEKTLAAQNAALETVDSRLLANKKALDTQQLAEYKRYRRESDGQAILQLASNEERIHLAEKQTMGNIEKILQKRQRHTVAEIGKQRIPLTVAGLVKTYTQLRPEDYLAFGIADKHISALQKMIERLLALDNGKQRLQRLKKALQRDQKESSLTTQQAVISALLAENQVTSKPGAVFQYVGKLGLYSKQARVLSILTEQSPEKAISYLIKLIMGGGKTKVIMPLLLALLADGNRLPVVLVPDASLNTNFSDLRATSLSHLQQNAFLFQFDRDTPCEPARLRHLYETFETARQHKQYYVTSPSCMQSLDLKYYEILYSKNHAISPLTLEQVQTANEQLHWLGLTRQLLKTKSTAVIDEGHLLLHIRKELNYSLGKANLINNNTGDMIATLFAWLDKAPVVLSSGITLTFNQLLKDPNYLTDEKMAADLMAHYIEEMCYGKTRPAFVDGLLVGSLELIDLNKYLLDDNITSEQEKKIQAALEAYPPIMARWMILREEFSHLFKLTLRNKMHENYGPDIKNLSNPFAIPYRAVNSPTPYIFANFLEAYNYTAQMIYCDGVKFDHFMNLLRTWQNQALLERQLDPTMVSQTELKFNYLFDKEEPRLSLLRLNFNDQPLIDYLYKKYGRTSLLVQQILRETLGMLTIDEAILRSDTLNLVGMFDKAIAFSATPENHRTYHPKIQMVYETSFLIESQVMDYLHEKKTPIETITSHSTDENTASSEFLKHIANTYRDVSVLLDCGGRLRGLSNLEVVKALDKAYCDKNIKHILFYQGSDLYAWKMTGSLNQETPHQEPLKLTSTDPDVIQKELDGCPPEERFTFLDQEHTVGVDIRQSAHARAVVTVDIKTTLSAFLQAVMRMRDFANHQEVIIAIDPTVKALIDEYRAPHADPLKKLFAFLKDNQTTQLEIDHFSAAIKKIRNLFREELDNRLLNETDPAKRDQAYRLFEHFFIDIQTDDIINNYQEKAQRLKTKNILEDCAKHFFDDWSKCLTESGVTPNDINISGKEIEKSLDQICKIAVNVCTDENVYPPFQGNREMQQQKQQLKQAQKKIETKKLDERQKPTLSVRDIHLGWIEKLIEKHDRTTPNTHVTLAYATCELTKSNWDFDEAISATKNLLYAHNNQKTDDVYNVYTKMPTAILYEKWDNELKALLVCAEEADALKKILAKNEHGIQDKLWLSTLSGANFTPMPNLNAHQLKMRYTLLEQANFFYGRADILFSLPTTEWLSDRTEEKLDFLEKNIKPVFGIHENQLERLSAKFNKIDQYIDHWAKYPLESPIITNKIDRASTAVKMRFAKILPYLTKIRETGVTDSVDKMLEKISLQDALLVNQYQKTWEFLRYLNDKKLTDASYFFMKNVENFSWGILCYAMPTKPITMNEKEITLITDKLTDKEAKTAWIRQVCMSPDCIATLSEKTLSEYMPYIRVKDFCYFLKNVITDNAQRISIIQRYFSLTSTTYDDLMAVVNLTKEFDAAFENEALEKKSHLSAVILLDKAHIREEALIVRTRDRRYCDIVHYLQQNQLLESTYLHADMMNILLILKAIDMADVALIKKIVSNEQVRNICDKLHTKYTLSQTKLEDLLLLIDRLSKHQVVCDHLYDLIDACACDIKQAGRVFKVLHDTTLSTQAPILLEDIVADKRLKEAFAECYSLKKPYFSATTCAGIVALTQVRAELRNNKSYAKHLDSLDHFTREVIGVLLDHDKKTQGNKNDRDIIKAINTAAHKHFKKRHLVLKVLADVFLALSVVGILVFAARKVAGKSFFFSQAQTYRQEAFENALSASQKWDQKKH